MIENKDKRIKDALRIFGEISFRSMKELALIALTLAIAYRLQAQNPCDDSELLRLKSLPKASLTESERKAFNKLNADCEKFKARAAQPTQQGETKPPKTSEQSDTVKVVLKEEPFATTRNFAILGAIGAFVAGIIVALNSITDSPF